MSDEIKEQIAAWAYPSELPQQLEGFVLTKDLPEAEERIHIFSYLDQDKHRCLSCFYNKTTKDFMLRRIFGLNEYNDMAFITNKLENFELILREKLRPTIKEMAAFDREKASTVLMQKGILNWDYQAFLPEELEGFTLYIAPSAPERLINGSYVIIDYSDFASQAQFVIYYNELKTEFYAEKKLNGIVETTGCMDAKSIKELEKRLDDLPELLKEFRKTL